MMRKLSISLQTRKIYKLIVTLLICLFIPLIIIQSRYSDNDSIRSIKYKYNSLQNIKTVAQKKDLLNIDLTKTLRFKDFNRSPVHIETLGQKYTENQLLGYVSNLESQGGKDRATIGDYEREATCDTLQYINKVEYSKETKYLPLDLVRVRKELMTNPKFEFLRKQMHANNDAEKDLSDLEIVQKYWFTFGGVSVWSCLLYTSRCV